MKIAIDASRYNTENPTGVERYCCEIINGLLKYYWQQKDFQLLLYSPREFDVEGAGSVRFKKRVIPFKRLWTQVRLSWAMLTERPEVLFVPGHVLPLIHPKHSIVTIHDVAFCRYPKAYKKIQRWYLNWSTRFAVKHAERIIVPSQAVKNDLAKFYKCKRGKVVVVHHGCEDKKTDLDGADIANMDDFFERYQFNPEKNKYMLFIGRLEKKKNIERMIEAFMKFSSHHPSWKLVLAGKPGHGFKSIQKMFFKKKLADKVIMPGYITDLERQFLSENCEFFVFPSLYEGFGLPLLSAFYYQKPIIVSDIGVFRELAEQAAYYVDPHKVAEISHAMMELAANQKMRKMLVGKGCDRLKKFGWEGAAEKTGAVIDEMVRKLA